MYPRTAVVDTGAGPDLIRRSSLPSIWTNNIRAIKDPGMTGATKSNVIVDGVILIYVRLGDLRVKAWFGVVTLLTVPLLLGTALESSTASSETYTHRSERMYHFIHIPSPSSTVWIEQTEVQHSISKALLMVEGRGGTISSGSRRELI